MSKHIVKVDKTSRSFRLVIPRNIILSQRWGAVTHVVVEDHWGDKLIIRRLFDDEQLKSER